MSFDTAMDVNEIYSKLDDKVADKYSRFDVNDTLQDILVEPLNLVNMVGTTLKSYILNDTPETRRVVEEIKKQVPKLTPTSRKILEVLYQNQALKLSVDDIGENLKDNYGTTITHNMIFKRLLELEQMRFVNQTRTQYGGIKWSIDDDGYDYYQSRGISQTEVEKISNNLPYQDYLVLNVFNEQSGPKTVEEITDYLQKQFNKTPNWDEIEVGVSLENLTQLNLLKSDDDFRGSYYTILPMGINVVQSLIEKENQGIYPKQKTSVLSGTRPSPTISATTQPVGTIMRGNDGNNWQIKENKNGIRRWVKVK
jgi:Fe2+ or Zn2+ uptake regulation protein